MPTDAPIKPKLVMVTASGRVSVVSDIDSETSKRLVALQRNLSYVIHGPGGVELSKLVAPFFFLLLRFHSH